MTSRIHSFPPIAAEGCKVLILGSMPSVTSLERHQYYGHKQNDFWPMMFAFFEQPYTDAYSVKQELLIKHGIALWDVLSSCEREGSLDSNIMNEIPNDINGLLVQYPTIEYIIFNGGKDKPQTVNINISSAKNNDAFYSKDEKDGNNHKYGTYTYS